MKKYSAYLSIFIAFASFFGNLLGMEKKGYSVQVVNSKDSTNIKFESSVSACIVGKKNGKVEGKVEKDTMPNEWTKEKEKNYFYKKCQSGNYLIASYKVGPKENPFYFHLIIEQKNGYIVDLSVEKLNALLCAEQKNKSKIERVLEFISNKSIVFFRLDSNKPIYFCENGFYVYRFDKNKAFLGKAKFNKKNDNDNKTIGEKVFDDYSARYLVFSSVKINAGDPKKAKYKAENLVDKILNKKVLNKSKKKQKNKSNNDTVAVQIITLKEKENSKLKKEQEKKKEQERINKDWWDQEKEKERKEKEEKKTPNNESNDKEINKNKSKKNSSFSNLKNPILWGGIFFVAGILAYKYGFLPKCEWFKK